jgi:hypothetical protein
MKASLAAASCFYATGNLPPHVSYDEAHDFLQAPYNAVIHHIDRR